MAGRGSPRTAVSSSVTHLPYYVIVLQTPICRSQDLCSTRQSKARARDLQQGLTYATSVTEHTAASGLFFIAGTEWLALCPRIYIMSSVICQVSLGRQKPVPIVYGSYAATLQMGSLRCIVRGLCMEVRASLHSVTH